MGLLNYFLKRELNNLIKNRVRLLTIGRTDALPANVRRELSRVIEATKDFHEWTLVLALNYGSRAEVADAARDYAAAVQAGKEKLADASWDRFSRYLYTAAIPEPDLLDPHIRRAAHEQLSCCSSALIPRWSSPRWPGRTLARPTCRPPSTSTGGASGVMA